MLDAREVTDRRRARGLVELSVCQHLRTLAAAIPAGQAIVEVGAYMGRATGWLLLGAQEGHRAHVTTVDPWTLHQTLTPDSYPLRGKYGNPDVQQAFRDHMAAVGATDAMLTVVQDYGAVIGRKWDGPSVGLLWHDAGHTAEAVEEDLTAWAPHVVPGGWVVLHDAGNPTKPDYGVVEGAQQVLDVPGWDWAGRKLMRWAKHPQRRGALLVRRRG